MSNLSYKYRVSLAIIAILLVVCMFLGSSFALWRLENEQETPNVITTGCIDVIFENGSENINFDKAYPISDNQGLSGNYNNLYTFTITNNCTMDVDYHIYLNSLNLTDATPKIDDEFIRYAIYKEGDGGAVANSLDPDKYKSDAIASFSNNNIEHSYDIANGSLTTSEKSHTYNLRLWIDEKATTDINDHRFEANIAAIAYARNS